MVTGGDVAFPDIDVVFSARDEMAIVYPDGHPVGEAPRIKRAGARCHP